MKIINFITYIFKLFFLGIYSTISWLPLLIINKNKKNPINKENKINTNLNNGIQISKQQVFNNQNNNNNNINSNINENVIVNKSNNFNNINNQNINNEQKKEEHTPVQDDKTNTTFADKEGINEKIKAARKNIKEEENIEKINNKKQKKIMELNFDDETTKRSNILQTYIFEARNPDGKFERSTFNAFSIVDVHTFLLNEGYEVYNIKTSKYINFVYGQGTIGKKKYKAKDLSFLLTQLSTYLRSGIPLIDSLRILIRQESKISKKKVIQALVYELVMGESLSGALEKQGSTFPPLLINMIKTSELTGELPETLDDMANYYEQTEKTRKQMISALTYPTIIFVMAIGIVIFIMLYVIPSFVGMYKDMDAEIPMITKIVIGTSEFLQNYYLFLILGIVAFIGLIIYSYKKIKAFRSLVQNIFMRIPVIGKVIIYNEITLFTKTFASLLNHNVFITDSMEILRKITNNEVYKEIIFNTINNLSLGNSISKSFKGHWAFPIVAYEMLLTGERTGELGKMMEKVSVFYQEQHKNLVTQLKSFVEPIMIAFLAFVVGGLLIAVVVPMFGIYGEMDV